MFGSESRKRYPVITKLSRYNSIKFLSPSHSMLYREFQMYILAMIAKSGRAVCWDILNPLGFLRKQNYDFQKIWHSDQANMVRKYIKDGNCACPLANQAYSNILCDFVSILKVLRNVLIFQS